VKFSGLVSDGIQLFLDRINLLLQTEMFLLLSTEQGEFGRYGHIHRSVGLLRGGEARDIPWIRIERVYQGRF